jgi:hypothetical protein
MKRPDGSSRESGNIDFTVNKVSFTFNISENRERDNLLLRYDNKPFNNVSADTTTKIWVLKGIDAIQQFFRAASWFI